MSNSKFLSDSGWKDIAAKNSVKDNGLLKKLADFKRVGDEKPDDALKLLDEALKLAAQLKKDKKTAPAAIRYLDELSAAADSAVRELGKAKAEADKSAKAKAEAEKKAHAEAAKKTGDDDDEEDESPELLTTKLKPLLRLVAKGETMHALLAKSGKQVVVMLSRKPIPPARRKMLADQLGGGSTKYYPGHCTMQAGATTFVLKAEVAGMSKLVKAALLEQTGLRLNKVRCRGEDGDDDDGDDDGPNAEQSAQGDDADEPAGPTEDSRNDSDEKPVFMPGVDTKLLEPELDKAPQVWDGTRDLLREKINALKQTVRAQVADEGSDLIDEIDGHLQKLDRIIIKLDRRLADSLANAGAAKDAASRAAELGNSKVILAEYIRYVRGEPLIEHLDRNPFGVKMELKATLAASLTQLARAIG